MPHPYSSGLGTVVRMYGVKLSDTEIRKRLTKLRNLERLHEQDHHTKVELRSANARLQSQLDAALGQITDLSAQVKDLQEQLSRLTDSQTKYKFYLFGEAKHQRPPMAQAAVARPPSSYVRPIPALADITDRRSLILDTCPKCQGPVGTSVETFTAYVEDIVFAPKTVTEYTVHRHWCSHCRQLVRAPLPDALPGMRVGLNTVLFILVEHYRAKKTDEQVVESLERYFGLAVSNGEVSEIRHKAADYFADKFAGIVRAIREASVIYVDETGWTVRGHHGQCWHVNAPEVPAVLYKLADSRAKDELQSLIGDYQGVVVSDFYRVYDGAGAEQQKCWVHLLREAHFLTQADPENVERTVLHDRLQALYGTIIRFQQKEWLATQAKTTEQWLDTRLHGLAHRDWQDTQCSRLAKRIRKYHHELLTCIRLPNVLPENNTAERGLRPVVVHRKITGGSRSAKGAHTYEVNRSVIETLRLEGGDLVAKLRDLLWQRAWSQKFGTPTSPG